MGSVRYFTASERMASSTRLSAPALSQRKQNWPSPGPQSPACIRCRDHSLKLATGPAFLLTAMTFVSQRESTCLLSCESNFSATPPTSCSGSTWTTAGILTSNSRCNSVLKTPFLSQRSTAPRDTRPLNSRLKAFHIGGTSRLSVKSTTAGRSWLSIHSRICRFSLRTVEKSLREELTNLLSIFALMDPSKTSGGLPASSGNQRTPGKPSAEARLQTSRCLRQFTAATLRKSLKVLPTCLYSSCTSTHSSLFGL
mmetsp:Transcript_69772/g.225619  ORF Transcript_69772/g.225619 Transcript_69772/m.225619 type:complete len:254 (+) Transcript_69772:471-1232(+)